MMSIYQLTIEELEQFFVNKGDKKFRAIQLYEWLYQKKITSFDEIKNIKKEMLTELKKNYSLRTINIIDKEEGKDVVKYLFSLEDDEKIEAVVMKHDYGISLCVSSQVGCNMSCTFCESGRRKKVRNLLAHEMVEQILLAEDDLEKRISHVVVMGIGEPFDNYEEVTKFIKIINHPKSLAIGSRHITISTCGIIPKIKEFMNYGYQVNLAISLHAPTDELRSQLMPINKRYPLKDLIEVVEEYIKKTNRRVTFEYILLKDVNDKEIDALALAQLLKGINGYVNLIPYNETSYLHYKRSTPLQIVRFYDILKKNKINVTIRREFGGNISAACGQLRSRKEKL